MFILALMSIILYILFFSSLVVYIAAETSSISQSQSLSYGKTIVSSPNGIFELGFFNLGNPNKIYLGIRYKNIPLQNVVWIANSPINGSSAILKLNSSGNLVLSHTNTVVWSTTSPKEAQNPVAELLDSGNLVIRDKNATKSNPETYLWQSFDCTSNTMLPGMKVGWDLKRNFNSHQIAWKSDDDPIPGDLSWGIVLNPFPEIYMMKGAKKYFRLGPWNGVSFSGVPGSSPDPVYIYDYVSYKEKVYYTWTLQQFSLITKAVLNQTTQQRIHYVWSETDAKWMLYSALPNETCDYYGICGANAYCSSSSSRICECLEGFISKSPEKWNSFDWSQGCVPKNPESCTYTDEFVKYAGMKVPDTTHTWLNESIGLEECRAKCLNNVSCKAYSNSDIRGEGNGCVIWFGDLFDIKVVQAYGQDLYIRIPGSGLEQHGQNKIVTTIATTAAAICGILLFCIVVYTVRRNIAEKSKTKKNFKRQIQDLDLPLFNLRTIIAATNSFSLNNKIGQGGFGSVYKGKMEDGREVAVKRLSSSSEQGITEFITEVKLIAKLQHRNLVKLLGCCVHGQEKLLVYEYMVNGSLNSFIFDKRKGILLDWPRRFQIIFGIARGLLYLHEDSRLRIIHRDLKTSNVLLDENLNPKIPDFGMARSFGGDQTEGNRTRVVGTYGYMAPEYAFDGLFSVKSDVFSFGILLMEIICGNKNRSFSHENQSFNLVGYAWTLWKEQNALRLIDPSIKDSCVIPQVLRCIHISLLCVQKCPEDRPTMSSVIKSLGCEIDHELVEPKEPGFFPRRSSDEGHLISNQIQMTSNDELSITTLNGR